MHQKKAQLSASLLTLAFAHPHLHYNLGLIMCPAQPSPLFRLQNQVRHSSEPQYLALQRAHQ